MSVAVTRARQEALSKEIADRRASGSMPELTSAHIGLAHHWRRMALLDNDIRLADDICRIIEALHSPVSSHLLVKRRKR
jgi:hypothetical protein